MWAPRTLSRRVTSPTDSSWLGIWHQPYEHPPRTCSDNHALTDGTDTEPRTEVLPQAGARGTLRAGAPATPKTCALCLTYYLALC